MNANQSPRTCQQWTAQATTLLSKIDRNEPMTAGQALATLNDAAMACEQAHRLDTSSADCLYRWGRAHLLASERAGNQADASWRLARLSGAVWAFEQALVRDSQHVGALLGLARACAAEADLLSAGGDSPTTTAALDMALGRSADAYRRAYAAQLAYKAIVGRSPPSTPVDESPLGAALHAAEEASASADEDVTSADALVNTVVALAGVLSRMAELCADRDERIWAQAADSLYAQADELLGRAAVEVPECYAELMAERAEVQADAAKTFAARRDITEPTLFVRALGTFQQAIAAAVDESGMAPADLYFDLGDLYHHIADARLTETDAYVECCDSEEDAVAVRENALRTVILPYFAHAREAYRQGVRAAPGNAVMQERLGDACFVGACVALNDAEERHLLAEAEHWYRSAWAADAEDDEVVARLAQVCHRQQRAGECAALLLQWSALGGGLQDLKHEDNVFLPEFVAQAAVIYHGWMSLPHPSPRHHPSCRSFLARSVHAVLVRPPCQSALSPTARVLFRRFYILRLHDNFATTISAVWPVHRSALLGPLATKQRRIPMHGRTGGARTTNGRVGDERVIGTGTHVHIQSAFDNLCTRARPQLFLLVGRQPVSLFVRSPHDDTTINTLTAGRYMAPATLLAG
ncbi:hypothetical protein THASP1DRAFT_24660 [Thamnocephalis sphaerospora]|uniref:Uncharacterized protein n=1 Tax=Thamnocephalis sphaerospora TaxID=78915 RepID=A0A4P9XMV0_9FUNG|nr:hypothetical protein THASP1DRAFT_24660 [Thamnocephalis sphaerospora]|eukprot:RKP07132.1 hypothetical protein THASP1DRAFT_24660 [Thamnocephalis sphaerospora]